MLVDPLPAIPDRNGRVLTASGCQSTSVNNHSSCFGAAQPILRTMVMLCPSHRISVTPTHHQLVLRRWIKLLPRRYARPAYQGSVPDQPGRVEVNVAIS